MKSTHTKWIFLFILALVWGSSFILIKKALLYLTPIQVGALRIIITAIALFAVGFKGIFQINKEQWYYIFLTALLGTFIPVFLFAYAVQNIDSSITSILNSLTPLHTLIIGALFFGFPFIKKQLLGVLLGLIGALILILKGAEINPNQNYYFALLVVFASIGYALNVNILKKHLNDLNALTITTGNFVLIIIPATIILWFTDFFNLQTIIQAKSSLFYLLILSVLGTALAKTLFNKLVQISSPIFSSSVTYLIPIVAILWGILDGEKISFVQFGGGFIILLGVYLVNRTK